MRFERSDASGRAGDGVELSAPHLTPRFIKVLQNHETNSFRYLSEFRLVAKKTVAPARRISGRIDITHRIMRRNLRGAGLSFGWRCRRVK